MLTKRAFLAALASAGYALPALAQSLLQRPIKMVVPGGPGGPADVLARIEVEDFLYREAALLDPDDRDERRILIEAEHPDFADALERDEEVVVIDGEAVNPRLHLALHEIVVEQLWENDPPEAWRTAQRLLAAGYERHEILHLLGSALAPQLWRAIAKGESTSTQEYRDALARLPRSSEGARDERRLGVSKHRLVAKARKTARQARKRNRKR